MHTAVRLNELIIEHSLNSQLVLLNLPKPPRGKEGECHLFKLLRIHCEICRLILLNLALNFIADFFVVREWS